MADSVLEQIAKNVLDTLTGITVTNGFSQDLQVIRAPKKISPRHLLVAIYQMPGDPTEEAPIMTDESLQAFAAVAFVLPEETDNTPVDTYSNAIAADIEKALMNDYHRGGLAIDTIITSPIYFPPIEGGNYAGVTVNFNVLYRTALGDPYTLAAG